jgi:multimeric flavodoxin WrbA
MHVRKILSPIYMFRIAGQMKFFVDRMYSYYQYKPEGMGYDSAVPPGKTYAMVISQGAADSDQYKRSARWLAGMAGTGLGFAEVGRIIHTNSLSAPAKDDASLLEEARAIGRKLVINGSKEQ